MDNKKLLKLILLVPGSVLLYIPLLLVLWENRGWPYTASGPVLLLSILLFWGGLALLVWAARLLIVEGQGTPLPMDPPANLVTDGPYRFVRNPMMIGAFAILLGEALYFESYFILIYFAVFFIAGLIMVPKYDEPQMALKYGGKFVEYKNDVPRWIPSWKAIRKNYLINKAADQAEKVKENLQNSQVVKKAAEKVDEVKEKMKK